MPILKSETLQDWEALYSNLSNISFKKIGSDSRHINKGDLFFGFDGIKHSVPEFIDEVLKNQPAAIFLDAKYKSLIKNNDNSILVFFSHDFRKKAHELIANIFRNPDRNIKMTGVTGTNGKTSIAYFDYLLSGNGLYIGTLGTYLNHHHIEGTMTTPSFLEVMEYLQKDKTVQSASIEVSSHALDQDRLYGIDWDYIIFSNLSQDHLDYHKDMDSYFNAKKKLFTCIFENSQKKRVSIINTDDEYGFALFNELRQNQARAISYGKNKNSNFIIKDIQKKMTGYSFWLQLNNLNELIKRKDLPQNMFFQTSLIGEFNIYNLTSVIIPHLIEGMEYDTLQEKIREVNPPPGRMQKIHYRSNQMAVIDYAHTPDAIENGLSTLNELEPSRIITIFGAGGDRDKTKRPLMAQAVERYSDYAIITSDNPRTENPDAIIKDIENGFTGKISYEKIKDRKLAITKALRNQGENEILYIAGKGHENYQIIGDKKNYFSDADIVKEHTGG